MASSCGRSMQTNVESGNEGIAVELPAGYLEGLDNNGWFTVALGPHGIDKYDRSRDMAVPSQEE